jgi:hypothetical protein
MNANELHLILIHYITQRTVHQQENIPLLASSLAHFPYFIQQIRVKQESREICIELWFDSVISEALGPRVWVANVPTDFAQNIFRK